LRRRLAESELRASNNRRERYSVALPVAIPAPRGEPPRRPQDTHVAGGQARRVHGRWPAQVGYGIVSALDEALLRIRDFVHAGLGVG